ncbi:MAG: MFS transporter [Acidimicrobiales bacterium]
MPLESSIAGTARAPARDSGPGGRIDGLKRRLSNPTVALFVILTAQLMVVLDNTIVNVALPHIQRGLGFSGTNLSWVINAYILVFGGLLLLGARAGDLLGRRRTFLIGIAVFSLASLAGGVASTSWMLLAARALQGVGGALAAPSALAILTTVFAEGPERMRALSLFTTVSAAGGATGLVAGGLLTEFLSWRWVMFVNVPIGIAVFVLGRFVINETPRRHGRLDIIGAITSTLGVAGIAFGLVEAGTDGWGSSTTVGSLVAGAVLLFAFVRHERRAEEPVLPLGLLAHPTRNAANVSRGLVYAGMYGMFFFLSQFFQDVRGYSPLISGLAFLPIPASVFLSSQLTSKVLVKRMPPKTVMLFGVALAVVGLLLSSHLGVGTPYLQVLVSLVLVGWGSGISLVSLTSASLAGVKPSEAGAASGLVNVVQQLGAALGVAVLVTVFGAVTRHAQLVTRSGAIANSHALSTLLRGFDDAFMAGAIFAAVAFALVAVVIRPRSLGAASEVAEETELEVVGLDDIEVLEGDVFAA